MTPEKWEAIGDLFDQALAMPAGERTAWIDQTAGTDELVRREVLSLLASHQAAPGGFVQKRIHHALELFHRTSSASTLSRVGPYRLERELGRGGMGAVFLAERDDAEYQAKVAVKLVRPGMDTEFILARFRRERQTLARLQHPNICRLLDGGTTEQGLPYIVMEFIDGPWITTHAAQHELGVEGRVRLFLEVCSAVDYAHRNFVVHRDLKPSNILVDAGDVPKLLDFGICKLLVEPVAGNDTAVPALTPSYASPEQIRGEAATIASDVYSLGAVLYELLTGIGPRRFEKLTPVAIQRTLEIPITRPSTAVGDPRISRQLAGDLDNILMRALDDEPERRYESAAQLADDLRRHLEHVPIRARPQTLGYRAGTFLRRHRGSTLAVAAVFMTLLVGAALSLREARLADARVGRAEKELASARTEQLVVYNRIAQIQAETGKFRDALQTYQDAIARAPIGRTPGRTSDPQLRLALADAHLGSSHAKRNLGDDRGALEAASESLRLYREAANLGQSNPAVIRGLAGAHAAVGMAEMRLGRLEPALASFRQGAATLEPLVASEPRNVDANSALALIQRETREVEEALARIERR